MGAFTRGEIVLLPFPFSTGSGEKKRPALVLSSIPYDTYTDYIVCAISTQGIHDPHGIRIEPSDVTGGFLTQASLLRPTYLASSSETRIIRKIGILATDRVNDALDVLRRLLSYQSDN